MGYGVYDMFDLGEFDQKGSVRTKYGTKDEYLAAIKAAQAAGLRVYADVVLNHKMGGDQEEEANAIPFAPNNRHQPIGDMQSVKVWTHFTFPGQQGKYSEMAIGQPDLIYIEITEHVEEPITQLNLRV